MEWPFPEDFSQSTIDGRNGSNACAFISLYFGQAASKGLLPPRQGFVLDVCWKDVLREAIMRGNDLHDEMFDHFFLFFFFFFNLFVQLFIKYFKTTS